MNSIHLSAAFASYLESKFPGNEPRIAEIIDRAENDLPGFLRIQFATDINGIYDITDSAVARNLREAITKNPVLRAEDKAFDDVSYTEALKWYGLFLKSRFNPLNQENYGPLPVKPELQDSTERPPYGKKEATSKFNQPELTPDAEEIHEGAEIQKDHFTTHERSSKARTLCIDYFKQQHNGHLVCECCGFDFSKAYNGIGDDYIEIHHRFPVSQRGGDYQVDYKKDLVPLCSNCHSMIHRIGGQGDCMSLEDLKARFIGKRYNED